MRPVGLLDRFPFSVSRFPDPRSPDHRSPVSDFDRAGGGKPLPYGTRTRTPNHPITRLPDHPINHPITRSQIANRRIRHTAK